MSYTYLSPTPHDHAYPIQISRHDAELEWRFQREQIRARIAALPSSSFERFKLKEDEAFYATFPQAQEAAIDALFAKKISSAQSELNLNYNYSDSLVTEPVWNSSAPSPSIHYPTPPPDYASFTLATALSLPSPCIPVSPYDSSCSSSPIPCELDMGASYYVNNHCVGSAQVWDATPQVPAHDILPTSIVTSEHDDHDLRFALQILAPSRRPIRNTRKVGIHQLQYTTPKPSPASPDFFSTSQSAGTHDVSSPSSSEAHHTCDGESETIAVSSGEPSSKNQTIAKPELSIDIPAPKKLTRSPVSGKSPSSSKARLSRPRPYSPPKSRSPSTSPQPTSSLPRQRKPRGKLPRDKDGKPIMACFFCRGRKIACGPPHDSDDPTCHQCARRGLECRFPTESRRGQRRPKKADDVSSRPRDDYTPTMSRRGKPTPISDDDLYLLSDDSDDSDLD
ncbi:hypothetical protein H0H93_003781 [Arthromyces matolae]|nr:hypothetical protein H0H93_003781 [Arthromyces matolae]